jgi:hypothetical protein
VKYLRFDAGVDWVPAAVGSNAPKPGAVLLQVVLDPALR